MKKNRKKDNSLPRRFTLDELPKLKCSKCGSPLKPNRATLHDSQNRESKFIFDHVDASAETYQGVFSIVCICTLESCEEPHQLVGVSYRRECYDPLHGEDQVVSVLAPTYSEPPLRVIEVKDSYPESIKGYLDEASALFWSHQSAAANSLRKAVEVALTDLGVAKYSTKSKKKRSRLTLHSRIERYQKDNPTGAELLMAVKWIGNEASHNAQMVADQDLDTGIRILCSFLRSVYDDDSREVQRLAKRITKRHIRK